METSFWGLYRDYCKDPFAHSLLSTRRSLGGTSSGGGGGGGGEVGDNPIPYKILNPKA